MKPLGVARRLLRVVPDYAKIAWWGLVRPNVGRERPLVVCQGVILRGDLDAPEDLDVLLSVRSDLRGWELPGGNPDPGEAPHDTLCREVREETGVVAEIVSELGVDSYSLPHEEVRALYYLMRFASEGPADEDRALRWLDLEEARRTLSFEGSRALVEKAALELGG